MPALVPIFGTSNVARIGNTAELRLFFNEVVYGVGTAPWRLTYNNVAVALSGLTESETSPPVYYLTASRAPYIGEVIRLSCAGGVFDGDLLEMTGFTNSPVQNDGNVAAPAGTFQPFAVADAVAAMISAEAISIGGYTLSAERKYMPLADLASLKDPLLTVIPKSEEEEVIGRKQTGSDVQIDVAIQKLVATDADSDAVIAAAGEIRDLLRFIELDIDGWRKAKWLGCQHLLWNPTHLKDYQVLTTLLTLTYRVYKA